jgi:hypothetical protein
MDLIWSAIAKSVHPATMPAEKKTRKKREKKLIAAADVLSYEYAVSESRILCLHELVNWCTRVRVRIFV